MLFEGSEKKVEIFLSPEAGDLLEKPELYWQQLVQACEAQILSSISTEECKAYLLSESSLFVWSNRLVLITCGQTRLIESILFLLKDFKVADIEGLFFERKNEYFPHMQKTNFFEDCTRLDQLFKGQRMRFGDVDGHHLFLYHLDGRLQPHSHDKTLEVLMYGLRGQASELLNQPGTSKAAIREAMPLQEWLPEYSFDDFAFDPFGYSMNALRGENYATIHVTPQEGSAYVSFETNDPLVDRRALIDGLVTWFQPESFDVVTFDTSEEPLLNFASYVVKASTQEALSCSFYVNHQHFFQPSDKVAKAQVLPGSTF